MGQILSIVEKIQNTLFITYRFRYVIFSYIQINLRIRYRRSFLGFAWTLLAPLLQYSIIGIVFWYTSNLKTGNFFTSFFCGAVLFNVFSLVLNRAPQIMVLNEHFIKKISMPKIIYVLSSTLYEFTNFLFSAVSLIMLGLVTNQFQVQSSLVSLPIGLLLYLPFVIGLSSILSVGGVYFRDLNYIVPPFMQAAFFLTPIAYQLKSLPPQIQEYLIFNPFLHFVEIIRVPIVDGHQANLEHWLICIGLSFISILLGLCTIFKFDNRIIFKL